MTTIVAFLETWSIIESGSFLCVLFAAWHLYEPSSFRIIRSRSSTILWSATTHRIVESKDAVEIYKTSVSCPLHLSSSSTDLHYKSLQWFKLQSDFRGRKSSFSWDVPSGNYSSSSQQTSFYSWWISLGSKLTTQRVSDVISAIKRHVTCVFFYRNIDFNQMRNLSRAWLFINQNVPLQNL